MSWLVDVWAAVAAYTLIVVVDQIRRARRQWRERREADALTPVIADSGITIIRRPIPPPMISAIPVGAPPECSLPEGAPTSAILLPKQREVTAAV